MDISKKFTFLFTFLIVLLSFYLWCPSNQASGADNYAQAQKSTEVQVDKPCAVCKPRSHLRSGAASNPIADARRNSYADSIDKLNSHVYLLDGLEYTKDRLVKAFIDVAFQKQLWQNDIALKPPNGTPFPWDGSKDTLNGYFANIPAPVLDYDDLKLKRVQDGKKRWYAEYIERAKGMPKFDSINRWEGASTLGVAFCFPLQPCAEPEDKQLLQQVKDAIAGVSKRTRPATGIELVYASPDDTVAQKNAKIRIIAWDDGYFWPDNKFKISRVADRVFHSHSLPLDDNERLERYMQGGIRFTPYARAQVEGYLVPDHQNELDLAVCYIWPHHQKEVVASLLGECLLRALGMPEMMDGYDRSLLGHWNKTYDDVSKRSVLDGPVVGEWLEMHSMSSLGASATPEQKKQHLMLREKILSGNREDIFEQHPPVSALSVRDIDLALLSMLYCKSIEPGMGRYDLLKVFYESNVCFQFENIRD